VDENTAVLEVYYRPPGVTTLYEAESPWLRPLTAVGLSTPSALVAPTPQGSLAHMQSNTVFFPPLPPTSTVGAVLISGWITAGQDWRHVSVRNGIEVQSDWQLWWRVSCSIIVWSATADYIGAATRYGPPKRYEKSEYLTRLVSRP